MKKYNVTLYDLFGYLVPGLSMVLVGSFGLFMFVDPTVVFATMGNLKWPWYLVVGYVLGHLIQAATTVIVPYDLKNWWNNNGWDQTLKETVLSDLSARNGLDEIRDDQLTGFHVVVAESLIDSAEMNAKAETFRALQGFFRAMTAVFVFMSVFSLSIMLISAPIVIKPVESPPITLTSSALVSILLFAILSAMICYSRFLTFGGYRLRTIFLSYYLLTRKIDRGSNPILHQNASRE